MEISKLKLLSTPNLNDVLPILDINGGVSGKPILKKATLESLLALADSDNSSEFQVPTAIKTTAESGDYFIGIDSTGTLYKISKADLLAGLSSSGGGNNPSTGTTDKILTYSSDGDVNGLFYWLGTSKGVSPWVNPHSASLLVTVSSIGFGTAQSLCDRADTEFYTNNIPDSWAKFQILSGKLKCNYYSIRNRFRSDGDAQHSLRNWKLQGSNDDTTWVDLDAQINNTFLNTSSKWLSLSVFSTTAYSYFRLLQNGANSNGVSHLCLGEIELYGAYTH